MRLPNVQPMLLASVDDPFDSDDWLFELKLDGFRAVAYVEQRRCRLVSRNGHPFKRFGQLAGALIGAFDVENAIVDGEICCFDNQGRSLFDELLFGRGTPVLAAFDLLWLNGTDLRNLHLIERKRMLSGILRPGTSSLLAVENIRGRGVDLFTMVRQLDLEGMVAKFERGRYAADGTTSWLKVINPSYSQKDGRRELFERRLPTRRPPSIPPVVQLS